MLHPNRTCTLTDTQPGLKTHETQRSLSLSQQLFQHGTNAPLELVAEASNF